MEEMRAAAALAALSCAAAIMDAAAVSRTSFAASPARMPVPAPRRRTPTCRRGASILAATGGAAVEGGGDEDARITMLKAKLAAALQGVVRASPRAAARAPSVAHMHVAPASLALAVPAPLELELRGARAGRTAGSKPRAHSALRSRQCSSR